MGSNFLIKLYYCEKKMLLNNIPHVLAVVGISQERMNPSIHTTHEPSVTCAGPMAIV